MISGDMYVVWENKPSAGPLAAYRILFHPYPMSQASPEHGPVRQQKTVQGEESLRGFFISDLLSQDIAPDRRQKVADDWMLTIRSEGRLSLRPVDISKELFDRLTVG
jgi:hypothetical protein